MAGRMNRFGATSAAITHRFATGSYAPTVAELGGNDSIDAVIDSVVDQVIQMMPEDMFLSLSDVELELIEKRATANQTTAALGIKPVIAGKVHIWKGQPISFREKPRLATDAVGLDAFTDPSLTSQNELPSAAFTVNATTGAIVLQSGYACNVNDVIYASYAVDQTTLSIPSLANLVADGAAGIIGSKLYPRQSSQWQYVDTLNERYASMIEALREGQWLPPEIRLMRYWKEVIPEADKKTSIQIGRLLRG